MSPVTTTLAYPLVQIKFDAPPDNGQTITAYQIAIFAPISNDFIVLTSVCDGASQLVMTQLGCSVQMSTLLSTYGYIRGQLVLVKVAAYNINGWSAFSSQNSGGVFV